MIKQNLILFRINLKIRFLCHRIIYRNSSRWKVMAKRCTSFCMFSNRWNKGVLCFTPMVSGGNPYNNS